MNTSILKLIVLLLAVNLWIGCASHKFPRIHPVPEHDRRELALERAHNYFIKARDYERRGLLQMAEHFYELAYDLDPSSKVLRDLLVKKYVFSRKYKQALVLIKGQKKVDALTDDEKRTIANLYIEMQQFRKAAETLEKISSLISAEMGVLGYLYDRLNDTKKAIEHYTRYFIRKPQSLNIGMKLANLYIREQMYDKAESLFVFLDDTFENKTEILNGLGLIGLLKKDTASAINFFKTALILDSTNTEAMDNIAQIYISRSEYPLAISYYEKMADNDYLTKFYHRKTLAMLYYYNKQYAKAEEILKSLLTENVDDYELHFYLGLVFAGNNKLALAEIELQKCLALKDTYVDAWLHLCYLALRQKDWDKALDLAKRFTERIPEAGASWRMYGYALNIKKQFKEAVEALRKALTFDQNDPTVWFELGTAYEREGNHKRAADAFRNVLRLKPGDDAAANYLGYMWADQGKNLDSAKVLLEMALEKEPENGAYLDSYGWIFYKMGKLEKAEEYILKAMEQIQDDPIIHEHLGDIRAKKGERNSAIEAYLKCIELDAENKELIQKRIDNLYNLQKKSGEVPVIDESQ